MTDDGTVKVEYRQVSKARLPRLNPRKGRKAIYDWKAILEDVASTPGEWVLIDDQAPVATARNIRSGAIRIIVRFCERYGFRVGTAIRNGDWRGTGRGELYMILYPTHNNETQEEDNGR